MRKLIFITALLFSTVAFALTIEEEIARQENINRLLYNYMVSKAKTCHNNIWHNPAFTPEQVLNGYGTRCSAIFDQFTGVQYAIRKINQDYAGFPLDKPVFFNEDGSCFLGS